jgi:hypothetical protein
VVQREAQTGRRAYVIVSPGAVSSYESAGNTGLPMAALAFDILHIDIRVGLLVLADCRAQMARGWRNIEADVHMGVRLTRPSLDLAILCEVDPDGISSQSRVRFRSGRL